MNTPQPQSGSTGSAYAHPAATASTATDAALRSSNRCSIWTPSSQSSSSQPRLPGRSRHWETGAAAWSSLRHGNAVCSSGSASSDAITPAPEQPQHQLMLSRHPKQAPQATGCPPTDVKGADARLGALQQVGAALQCDLASLQSDKAWRGVREATAAEEHCTASNQQSQSTCGSDMPQDKARHIVITTPSSGHLLALNRPAPTLALQVNQWPQRTSVSMAKRTW